MPVVYVVEDDDSIRDMVVYALSSSGLEAEGYGDGGTFFDALKRRKPSLILLDIMLPHEDGMSILKRLRASGSGSDVPVIILSAKNSERDRVRGLDLGADDYITKPFSVMEVIARVRAVLRRSDAAATTDLHIGGIALFGDRREVEADGITVKLTFKEFELLRYLMQNTGTVHTRDHLLDAVWGYGYGGESRTVDMHIGSLRKKLGGCGGHIATVRNIGYKLEERH